MHWIHLAVGRKNCPAVLNKVMWFMLSQIVGNFITNGRTASFTKRTALLRSWLWLGLNNKSNLTDFRFNNNRANFFQRRQWLNRRLYLQMPISIVDATMNFEVKITKIKAYLGSAVAQWSRCCATNQKVAGSIPDGVIWIFHWHNTSDHTMALGSNQPLTVEYQEHFLGIKAGGA